MYFYFTIYIHDPPKPIEQKLSFNDEHDKSPDKLAKPIVYEHNIPREENTSAHIKKNCFSRSVMHTCLCPCGSLLLAKHNVFDRHMIRDIHMNDATIM